MQTSYIQPKSTVLITSIIIGLIAWNFGQWFAIQQLSMVAAGAVASYPKSLMLNTILKCVCTILIFFAFSTLFVSHISRSKLASRFVALSFIPLLLVGSIPISLLLSGILCIQLVGIITVYRKSDYLWLANLYLVDLLALIGLFTLHVMLTKLVSPLHWKMAMFTTFGAVGEEIQIQAPFYKGFSLAKQFVFSNFDYSEWGSILNPPITLSSPFMQLTAFIVDLPSMSPIAFHKLLAATQFMLMVSGSFGLYLFLKYPMRLNVIYAFFGGCLMFFSATPLLFHMLSDDGAVFLTCYAIFPYALLLIALAYQKQNYIFACWAGTALASQLFFLTPHPEGILYSTLFYGIFTFVMCISTTDLGWQKRIGLGFISFMVFGALCLYPLLPILIDQALGNSHTFAHTGDIDVNDIMKVKSYLILLAIFGPVSFIVRGFQKNVNPVYISALVLTLVLAGLYAMTTSHKLVTIMVQTLHVGLHVWAPWRIGLFFCIGVFIIAMTGLQAITEAIIWLADSRVVSLKEQTT